MHSGPHLTIDLKSICHNYLLIQELYKESTIAAVVKSDSYKLGDFHIIKTLSNLGCKDFYVANIDEAIALRKNLQDNVNIYVLYGIERTKENLFNLYNLIPVLNSTEDVFNWTEYAKHQNKKLPAILKLNTGMNRLGLNQNDLEILDKDLINKYLSIKYNITHLACGRTCNVKNNQQLELLKTLSKKHFPNTPLSIAASNILTLNSEFSQSMIRVGMNLYGAFSPEHLPNNPLQFAFKIEAKVLQILNIEKGETIGYTDQCVAERPMKLATIAIGYADGLPFAASNGKYSVKINENTAPIVGSITMNFTMIDITDISDLNINQSTWVTIIDSNQDLHDLAEASNSSQHELITRFGAIVNKRYLNDF